MKFKWTSKELALLGRMPDSVLAKQLGLDQQRVAEKRKQLNIPSFAGRTRWGQTELGMLGRYSDQEIAQITGRHLNHVIAKREELGLKPPS